MNNVEQLAFSQAVFKAVSELVSTKDPDSLRAEVDREFLELYEKTGAKSFDVKINDVIVGLYSMKFSKERPQEVRHSLEVKDYEALAKWFNEVPDEELRYYIALNLRDYAEWVFNYEGEVPDGCEVQEVITAAVPKQVIGGMLKVDGSKVCEAMRGQLGASVAGLLGGSDES